MAALAALGWWYLDRPAPIAVRAVQAETGLLEERVANTRAGTIKACRRAQLSPSVGGQIADLRVAEGDQVQAGTLLLELWNLDLQAELALSRADAAAADSKARASCLEAEVAQREADRSLRLRGTGATSEELIDKAVTAAKAAQATCEASRAGAEVAAAKIEVTRAKLARTQLHAPFDGVVAELHGELNEYVTPSPPGIPTPPVIDLIGTGCFYVEAPMDEVDASRVLPGQTARITMDAFRDREFAGTVRRVADYVLDYEKQARTLAVEVSFDQPDQMERLLAGYSADVEVILQRSEQALRIPTEALFDGDQVLLLDRRTGLLQQQRVRPGLANWDFTEITEGLAVGDWVVTSIDREGVAAGAAAVLEADSKQ